MKSYYCLVITIFVATLALTKGFPKAKEREDLPGQVIRNAIKHVAHMTKYKKDVGPLRKKWIPPFRITHQVAKATREDTDSASKKWVPPPPGVLNKVAKRHGLDMKWLPPFKLSKKVAKEVTAACEEMNDAFQDLLDAMLQFMSEEEIAEDDSLTELLGEDYDILDPNDLMQMSCALVELGNTWPSLPEEERQAYEEAMQEFVTSVETMKALVDAGVLDNTDYYDSAMAMLHLYKMFDKYGLLPKQEQVDSQEQAGSQKWN